MPLATFIYPEQSRVSIFGRAEFAEVGSAVQSGGVCCIEPEHQVGIDGERRKDILID